MYLDWFFWLERVGLDAVYDFEDKAAVEGFWGFLSLVFMNSSSSISLQSC